MKITRTLLATLAALGMAGAQASQVAQDSQQFVFVDTVAVGSTYSYTFSVSKAGELDGTVFGVSSGLDASFQWLTIDGSPVAGLSQNLLVKSFSLQDYAITAGSHTLTMSYQYNPLYAPGYVAPTGTVLGSLTYSAAPVPEPESLALVLAGLGALGLSARRRKLG